MRGAVAVARRLRVSPLLIGLTLVGFGTSTPELVTSLQAAYLGAPGIAIGNVVGSNIANILLILGVAALLSPMVIDRKAFGRDGSVLVVSSLMCLGAVLSGRLQPLMGAVFVMALAAYVAVSFLQDRARTAADARYDQPGPAPDGAAASLSLNILFLLLGLAMTIGGARLLVVGAIDIAEAFGISETVIGLTIVAVGTSLPELVTSVAAAIRKQSDLAFGNVIGSNIYNVLFILGATAMVKPLPVPEQIVRLDIWVMLFASALLVVMAMTAWRISRLEGALLLASYIAYSAWLAVLAS